MPLSGQWGGLFTLAETRGSQLHRERNRCLEIRATIQPGRKPQIKHTKKMIGGCVCGWRSLRTTECNT
uniref:Uncharacterized protein n=1 Tax=Knipowitschia caucasica TaxID=637954 RepID=A0AAV2KE41_KNICA